MKSVIIIVSFYMLSIAAEVRDFAPIKIGSQWKYSYFSSFYEGGGGKTTTDSLEITIKIFQSFRFGEDSIVQLQIIQTGIQSVRFMGTTINMISETYFDSVVIRGDLLFKKNHADSKYVYTDYKCPVFPFWASHMIGSDSLTLENLKGQDLYAYYYSQSNGVSHQQSVYIQNVGLLKDTIYWSRGPNSQCGSKHLLSFESVESSAIKSIPTIYQSRSSVNKLTLWVKPPKFNGFKLFSIDGKMAFHNTKCVPGCYILERNDNNH